MRTIIGMVLLAALLIVAPAQAQPLTDAERALLLYLYRSQQPPALNPGMEAGRGMLNGLREAQEQQEREAERARRAFPPPPPTYTCRPDGIGNLRCSP
jgi:hypothetical protein